MAFLGTTTIGRELRKYARSISRDLVTMSHTQEADRVFSRESIESLCAVGTSAIGEAILRVLLFDSLAFEQSSYPFFNSWHNQLRVSEAADR